MLVVAVVNDIQVVALKLNSLLIQFLHRLIGAQLTLLDNCDLIAKLLNHVNDVGAEEYDVTLCGVLLHALLNLVDTGGVKTGQRLVKDPNLGIMYQSGHDGILAVLEKRLGLRFSQNDVYINVIGGLHIDEPSADVGIALALISSLTDRVVPDDLIAIGELGLSGECRTVTSPDQRIHEAERLGFSTVVLPHKNTEHRKVETNLRLTEARSIFETLSLLLPKSEGEA